ncbi:hypothetical protein H9P43_003940 [Blastocladiella emersonii ATCC 22665]|nr:hypothetical protein H9P43_003940 [Blastocladiella emersonii ATCC 22665]
MSSTSGADSPSRAPVPSSAPPGLTPASEALPLPPGKRFSDLPIATQDDLIRLDLLVLDADPAPLRRDVYLSERRAVLQHIPPAAHRARGDSLGARAAAARSAGAAPAPSGLANAVTASPTDSDAVTGGDLNPDDAAQHHHQAEVVSAKAGRRRTWVVDYDGSNSGAPPADAAGAPPVPTSPPTAVRQSLELLQAPAEPNAPVKRRSLFDQESLTDATPPPPSDVSFSTALRPLVGQQQPPTVAREPTAPLADETTQVSLPSVRTLAALVAARAAATPNGVAYRVLDAAGAEVGNISWAQLQQKAEHEAALILSSPALPSADAAPHVALVYRRPEIIELVVGMVAVWLAGRVAVPVAVPAGALGDDDVLEIEFILRTAACPLVLSTDATMRLLSAEAGARGIAWPPAPAGAWWDTFALPASIPAGTTPGPLCTSEPAGDTAYVEFAWSAAGELRGLAVGHAGLLAQQYALKLGGVLGPADIAFTHLEARAGLGLHLLLASVYSGFTTIVAPGPVLMEVGALWLNLLARYQVSLTSLTASCIARLSIQGTAAAGPPNPSELARLRLVLIDEPVLRPATLLAARAKIGPHLTPHQARTVFSPTAALPELGGLVLAFRDCLADSAVIEESEVAEMLMDRASLHQGRVVLIEGKPGAVGCPPGAIPVCSSGLPCPTASIAIVSRTAPRVLMPPNTPGEIYVATAAVAAGSSFLSAPSATQNTFHQRPLIINDDETMSQSANTFVRTGYLGCLVDGNVLVVLGRVADVVEDPTTGLAHYPMDVAGSVQALIKGIDACAVLAAPNDAGLCLPVLVLETARPEQELSSVATSALTLAQEIHHLRCFTVLCYPPGALPRTRPDARLVPALLLKAIPHLAPAWVSVHTHALPAPASPETAATVYQPVADAHVLTTPRAHGMPELKYRSLSDMLLFRADKTGDKDAYVVVDAAGGEAKTYSWRKLANKVSALASILSKKGVRAGDHVVLMYSHSLDYVVACHACIYSGIVAIPVPIPDAYRLQEDVPALLSLCADFNTQAILCNGPAEDMLRSKPFQAAVKRAQQQLAHPGGDDAAAAAYGLPSLHNTSKIPKSTKVLGADGLRLDDVYITNRDVPAILHAHFDPDMHRTVVKVSHARLLEHCQLVAHHLRLSGSAPLLASVRTYNGLGFLFTVACGVFTGAPTLLLAPQLFSEHPRLLFDVIALHGVRDTFLTWPMLEYAMDQAGLAPEAVAQHLASARHLVVAQERMSAWPVRVPALTPTLGRPGNAMITGTNGSSKHAAAADEGAAVAAAKEAPSPVTLSLPALRSGFIEVVRSKKLASGKPVLGQHVSVVPAGYPLPGTTVVVVDPVAGRPVAGNQLGELWVHGPMNVEGIVNPNLSGLSTTGEHTHVLAMLPGYAAPFYRTGEYGFLHRGAVYPLGRVADTFRVGAQLYFAADIEATVEAAHPLLGAESAAAFVVPPAKQGGDPALVVVVEVDTLAMASRAVLSAIPVICLTVYAHHALVVDTIVFLEHGMLAKSRLLEKQRSKIRDAFLKGVLPSLYVFHMA